VVIEDRSTVANLYARLDALADVCVAGTKVIVIGYANDVNIYRELLRRGVSEYIVAPVDPISLIAGISRLTRTRQAISSGGAWLSSELMEVWARRPSLTTSRQY